jgi:hypothetical protein
MNQRWEVDAMTPDLHELFEIGSTDYQAEGQKFILNILICAPKLLKYSQYRQYLTDEDKSFFGIVRRHKNVQILDAAALQQLAKAGAKKNFEAKRAQI